MLGVGMTGTFNIPVLAVSRGPSEKGCRMIWLPLKRLQRRKTLGTWSFSNFSAAKIRKCQDKPSFFGPPDFTKADMHFLGGELQWYSASYRFPVHAQVPPCLAAAKATRSPTNRSAAKVTWIGCASSIFVAWLEMWNDLSWIDVYESVWIHLNDSKSKQSKWHRLSKLPAGLWRIQTGVPERILLQERRQNHGFYRLCCNLQSHHQSFQNVQKVTRCILAS